MPSCTPSLAPGTQAFVLVPARIHGYEHAPPPTALAHPALPPNACLRAVAALVTALLALALPLPHLHLAPASLHPPPRLLRLLPPPATCWAQLQALQVRWLLGWTMAGWQRGASRVGLLLERPLQRWAWLRLPPMQPPGTPLPRGGGGQFQAGAPVAWAVRRVVQ